MAEDDPYFQIIKAAVPVPMPDHMRLSWQPIEEYDDQSTVMLKSGSVKRLGKWSAEDNGFVEVFALHEMPLDFEPQEFSFVSDRLKFAILDA